MRGRMNSIDRTKRRFLTGISTGIPLLSGCVTDSILNDGKTPHLMLTNRTDHSIVVNLELTDGKEVLFEDTLELEENNTKTYYDFVDDNSTYVIDIKANDIRSSREWSRGEGMLKARVFENEIKFVLSMA